MGTTALAILCAILMLVGLVGVILPFLPGVPLAWLGLFIYALGTGFETISIAAVVVFFVLTVLISLLDFVAPALGARKYRASKPGIIGAFLGSIAGIFVLGLWGIILGPLIGAFLGELAARWKFQQALGATVGAFLGFIVGSLFKLILILVMAGFFVVSLF
ncbi:MAG: DUF456 domain-containing protein [Dehalococcoidia bacterium]